MFVGILDRFIDAQNIEATFKNGVLTLTLLKTETQQNEKKISVKTV